MKEDFIRRKERWAKKMSGRERPTRPNAGRLPPGQHEVNNFPVLDLGVHPEIPLDKWQLKIHGKVDPKRSQNEAKRGTKPKQPLQDALGRLRRQIPPLSCAGRVPT